MFKISKITLTLIILILGCVREVRSQGTNLVQTKPNPVKVIYTGPLGKIGNDPFRMQLSENSTINLTLFINTLELLKQNDFDRVLIRFKVNTLAPQFDILRLHGDQEINTIVLNRREIYGVSQHAQMFLVADYIGHVTIEPTSLDLYSGLKLKSSQQLNNIQDDERLHIVIVPPDTILNLIFIISVSAFIAVTYVNIGAQLDIENIQKLICEPKTMILGLIVSIIVMPIASWFAGSYFLPKQSLYRIGSFVFACGPAASASTLWTAMLDSDKELSVGLQFASTVSAIITMPLLLYLMERALSMEGSNNAVRIPYTKLIQTLTVLSIALWIGYKFVGQSKKAKEISSKVFRPLTFFVLLSIIIFSSIIYYYVYAMFDLTIVLASFMVTMTTYIISGLLGYIINGNFDHSVAISISSTYKNSGIAFAVLAVAFESPDTYIAYVPCLTQVVTTSLTLYLFYCILKIINLIRRRNQPPVINAEMPANEVSAEESGLANKNVQKEVRSGSIGDKSTISDEANSNELMTINVHDVVPGSPVSQEGSSSVEEKTPNKYNR